MGRCDHASIIGRRRILGADALADPVARGLAAAAVALLIGASCATAPAPSPVATRAPGGAFVLPSALPNGRAELTLSPSYRIGTALSIPISIVASSGTITGPISARIMASGINEQGAPAEVLVRDLAVQPVTASTTRTSTAVAWDTRDEKGMLVPADAYALVLEFRSDAGGTTTTTRVGATLELR